jgi:hypothetical protein
MYPADNASFELKKMTQWGTMVSTNVQSSDLWLLRHAFRNSTTSHWSNGHQVLIFVSSLQVLSARYDTMTQAGAGIVFLHEPQIRCFEQIIWRIWIH